MSTSPNKDSSIFSTEISNLIFNVIIVNIVNILRLHLLEDNIFIPYVSFFQTSHKIRISK